MSNPGLELHDLYASWRDRIEGSKSAQTMKRHLRVDTSAGMREIRHAFALLTTVDEILRRFELDGRRFEPYRKQLDGWARVPMSVQAGWNSGVVTDHLITETTLDQIQSFGAYLEGKVLELEPSHDSNLRSLIAQADALLDEDDFDPALRQYLRRLISAIRYALDDEQAGKGFDFTAAVEQLWVALNAAAERAPESQRPRWRKLVEQISVGIAIAAPVEAAGIVLSAITT
jgi:hypothetical protein